MAKDPWTDPDPQPGDFDAYLASIDRRDPSLVEVHAGNPDAKLTRVVRVSGEDAALLDELAAKRGQRPGEVVAALLRSA
jgi:hypothetical protein